MQRDKGYASDEECSKIQRKRQRISKTAQERFRQHAEGLQQQAVMKNAPSFRGSGHG